MQIARSSKYYQVDGCYFLVVAVDAPHILRTLCPRETEIVVTELCTVSPASSSWGSFVHEALTGLV